MNIHVNFEHSKPVIAVVYNEDGSQFMKSEIKVKIPTRPYYDPDSKYSCTEAQYNKYKNKVLDNINKAVLKSLPEELYGTINIHINILDNKEKIDEL